MRPRGLLGTLAAASLAAACAAGPAPGSERAAAPRAEQRRLRRAYGGAPPVIPHAVAALGRQDCLGCHAEGIDLGDEGLAPTTPHAGQVNCQQCHVEQQPGAAPVRNAFLGMHWPTSGARAYPGAPPSLPHRSAGRENCLGCHGGQGGSPIRSPHPDRASCRQCHVEAAPGVAPWRTNVFGGPR